MAASVAIAVPQMPMKWMRFICDRVRSVRARGFLNDESWAARGDDPGADPQRQAHERRRRMAGWKAEEHWSRKAGHAFLNHRTRGDGATWFVASWKLPEDNRCRVLQPPGLTPLRQHPVNPIRTL